MGGGDLNLKKSWHPQTIRNVERVWKAEQKATAEAKKIEQLQRELTEERSREDMQRHAVDHGIAKKKSERLDWMYATPGQVDREQYLLGKAVDKHVDPLANADQEDNSLPGSSFSGDANANTPADLAAKVRDDPLFLIRKKEEEKKKELLNNPIKMKELRQMLQANLSKTKKKKEKKKKKKEKKEKRKRNKADSDSDTVVKKSSRKDKQQDSDHHKYGSSDYYRQRTDSFSNKDSRHRHRQRSTSQSLTRLPQRTSGDKHHKQHRSASRSPHRGTRKQLTSDSRSRSRSPLFRKEQGRDRRENHRRKCSSSSPLPQGKRSASASPIRNGNNNTKYRHQSPQSNHRRTYSPSLPKKTRKSLSPRRVRDVSRSPPRKFRRSPSPSKVRDVSRTPPRKSRRSPSPRRVKDYSQIPPRKSRRSPSPRKIRDVSRSPPRKSRRSPSPKRQRQPARGSAVSKKMTAEELERRREEMLENAKWRNDQRTTNVKNFREKENKEAEEEVQNSGKSAEFISSMKVESYSSKTTSSVSDRIKRNINSIQRTKADLDTFLVKK